MQEANKNILPAIVLHNGMPAFENELIRSLYAYNYELPAAAISNILTLPDQSLRSDIRKVFADSIDRYAFFISGEAGLEYEPCFLMHALFIAAEKGWNDFLPEVFDLLREGDEYIDFYLDDASTEWLWIALYKLGGQDHSSLFEFIKEPGPNIFAKNAVNQALLQLYCHHPHLRSAILEGFKNLTGFLLAQPIPDDWLYNDLVADIVCTMAEISFKELEAEIAALYLKELVDTGYAGTFESLKADYEAASDETKPIPGMIEMYQEVLDTWVSYSEADYNLLDGWSEDILDRIGNDTSETGPTNFYDEFNQFPFVRQEPKVGRNDACPCGSGKKYKKCCMAQL